MRHQFGLIQSTKKKPFLLWAWLLLLLAVPKPFVQACGPDDFTPQLYNFLKPNLLEMPDGFQRFFLSFDQLYMYYGEMQREQIKGNLEEWQATFCEAATIEDISQIIYKTSSDELQLLRSAVMSDKLPIDYRLAANTFAQTLKRNRCGHTIDYLIFAKRCEPHVLPIDSWSETKRDTVAMQQLIQQGEKAFKKCKSNYIRLRYAYQLIRLAHYAYSYQQVLDLYDNLLPKIDPVESIINYWIKGHYAGALLKLGRRTEAAYAFLQIFLQCPSKRMSAYQSFQVEDEAEWEKVRLMCQTDEERAGLYAIRSQSPDSRAIMDMQAIHALDPKSEWLELILVQEMSQLEKDFLGLEFNDQRQNNKRRFGLPRKGADQQLIQLDSFVRFILHENKVARPPLWKMANGYLEYLRGDTYAAAKTFNQARKDIPLGSKLAKQLQAFELAVKVEQVEALDSANEELIYDIMLYDTTYQTFDDFPDFVNDRIGHIYAQNGHPGKSFRCHYSLNELKRNPQLDIVDDLIQICQKPEEERTRLEEALIINKDNVNILNELFDIQGSWFMGHEQLEQGLEAYKRIPITEHNEQTFNPFIERLDDCIHCPIVDSLKIYSKSAVIQRIFELEYKSRADIERGAEYFYLLGLAHYNMSYFGHSWELFDHFRSGANWYYQKDQVFPSYGAPFGNREYQDLRQPLEYFTRALSLATDPEIAAKCAFMAARCEHMQYYISKDFEYAGSNQIPNIPPGYNYYFQLLLSDYAGTEFFQEAIRECKYFEAYATR